MKAFWIGLIIFAAILIWAGWPILKSAVGRRKR